MADKYIDANEGRTVKITNVDILKEIKNDPNMNKFAEIMRDPWSVALL